MPTYRVHYEVVRHTLYANVEADSKNAAATIVQNMEEIKLGIGKCQEIVVVHIEQYFSALAYQSTGVAADGL
jgi:hypothetical protein